MKENFGCNYKKKNKLQFVSQYTVYSLNSINLLGNIYNSPLYQIKNLSNQIISKLNKMDANMGI